LDCKQFDLVSKLFIAFFLIVINQKFPDRQFFVFVCVEKSSAVRGILKSKVAHKSPEGENI